mmetsp:Transcript_2121/g.5247  ORF Transcript_2121/g.5247 Transcript_2121/m.5247 type:complete len:376 (+) Transcript_2121:1803-2930(+)
MESAPNPESPKQVSEGTESLLTSQKDTQPTQPTDPRELLHIALEHLRANAIEDAIQLLSTALKAACLTFGEGSEEAAVFYYHYGDALLRQYENSQDENLFGVDVPQEVVYSDDEGEAPGDSGSLPQDSEQVPSAELQSEEKPSNTNESSSEDEAQAEPQGNAEEPSKEADEQEAPEPEADCPELEDGDLQICWEVLEFCRVILERGNSNTELLYKVHLRIGDLQTWNERFDEAKEEYSKALEVLGALEGVRPTRRRAEIFFLLGNNSLCRVGHEASAAEFFSQALEVLKEYSQNAPQHEAEEILGLISDIEHKREDAIEQQKSFQAIREAQPEEEGLGKPQISTAGGVMELGVLGKRKREEGDSEFMHKRQKQSP